jgi:hypothetical protein
MQPLTGYDNFLIMMNMDDDLLSASILMFLVVPFVFSFGLTG